MRKTSTLAAVVLSMFAGAIACDDSTDLDAMAFTASLSTANEIGPIILPVGVDPATGIATVVIEQGVMTVNITITGDLTSAVTGAHIHGPASTTENADIIFDFTPVMAAAIAAGATTGTIVSASYDLLDMPVTVTGELRVLPVTLVNLLNAGLAYVNVHTTVNPSGEVRGQLFRD
jgi:hypothetical protein